MGYHVVRISDRSLLAAYFGHNPFVNAYALGDLDSFFWPRTEWFGIYQNQDLKTIVLLYSDDNIPVLLAIDHEAELLGSAITNCLTKFVPAHFYAHLAPSLLPAFQAKYECVHHGTYLKMGLRPPTSFVLAHDVQDIFARRLTSDDLAQATLLFKNAYPGNWFSGRMLETGKYFGAFNHEEMVGIAGVHVYSPSYKVAALGNITVAHDWRKRHIGAYLTSVLCEDLLQELSVITLNVKADNFVAIRCYEKLGFTTISRYEEVMISAQ
ncbi:MAG: hypothetical protein A2X86_04540 [Bdellovibrionales bacterium GWA2_49_15]|nr:MAG: hypothetical protein A2X86_04540 [Bdellovibrionales bacterium GWA2_49_15]